MQIPGVDHLPPDLHSTRELPCMSCPGSQVKVHLDPRVLVLQSPNIPCATEGGAGHTTSEKRINALHVFCIIENGNVLHYFRSYVCLSLLFSFEIIYILLHVFTHILLFSVELPKQSLDYFLTYSIYCNSGPIDINHKIIINQVIFSRICSLRF